MMHTTKGYGVQITRPSSFPCRVSRAAALDTRHGNDEGLVICTPYPFVVCIIDRSHRQCLLTAPIVACKSQIIRIEGHSVNRVTAAEGNRDIMVGPYHDVTVSFSSSDTVNGVTFNPDNLTFTSDNWSSQQTLTVTAVDDAYDEGIWGADNQTFIISVSSVQSSCSGHSTRK